MTEFTPKPPEFENAARTTNMEPPTKVPLPVLSVKLEMLNEDVKFIGVAATSVEFGPTPTPFTAATWK